MKRRLLIIAVCVLLGAAVNVAVARGCALLLDFNPPFAATPMAEHVGFGTTFNFRRTRGA